MDLLTPSIGLVFWTTIAFLILMCILSKYGWKPIIDYINNRENFIAKSLIIASKVNDEIKKLNEGKDIIIKNAYLEKDKILKDANNISNIIIENAKKKAHNSALEIITNTKNDIEIYKKQILIDIQKEINEISILIAKQSLKNVINSDDDHMYLIKKIINNITLKNHF